jgi:hypothetical protein
MVVKKKVSLGGQSEATRDRPTALSPNLEVLELFFNTGIVFHEVARGAALPDTVSSFKLMADPRGGDAKAVRRAAPGEEPDVEISAADHLPMLTGHWFPVPYQLSNPFAVQLYLGPSDRGVDLMLAVDTSELAGSKGQWLDAAFDENRPFRALNKDELGAFLEHAEVKEYCRKLERMGVDRALLKLAAVLETVAPLLPKVLFRKVTADEALPVSLVVDFGNSRSTAVLVEAHDQGISAVPLALRDFASPLRVSDEAFDSRVTLLPPLFDRTLDAFATAQSFQLPSVARLGREATDRALETPHRYACTLSSPKRYLWDARKTRDRWHFGLKLEGEYRPIYGKLLKYIPDESGGVYLREDGPSAPAEPRYAPRTMMLFALVELIFQAVSQVNSIGYRKFQGKEGRPRFIKHLVMTYPSAMPADERAVYEALARNAVLLVGHILHLAPEHRPNWNAQTQAFDPFLFVDEAMAAQAVYLYQEVSHTFDGSMEEFVRIYGRADGTIRIASVDIGGGTTDVMVAEYEDRLPGTGTALAIKKLFQDGVNIAGDEVCRGLVEDVLLPQVAAQLPDAAARQRFSHLFGAGDAGHGSHWQTLRSRLVPFLWLPLARCFWAIAEGHMPDGANETSAQAVPELLALFGQSMGEGAVLAEADAFLASAVPGFPGLRNLMFRLDRAETERAIVRVLREPLRRYADILAQFDIDILVLAGRASALTCVQELFVRELPVARPRIRTMSDYRVGEWYPSKWKDTGRIKDAKSTVAAGSAILHLASRNRLPGFLIDSITSAPDNPVFGLYQDTEPHIARQNELFRDGPASPPFVYTHGMRIGFRNVDSEEMDGAPLFEVHPASPEVESALLEDRVALSFVRGKDGRISIGKITSQRGEYHYEPTDFELRLRTATHDRYWLDTGSFMVAGR